MSLPTDYAERVYAGVLGKLIGVYLGRPFEQWSHERIERELGEIRYYVHEQRGHPLIVTDDDIAGTFTFFRSLRDHDPRAALSAADIGETWLNYILEKKTILWWGGIGHSTEHTAYHRLKHGMTPPETGAIRTNGRVLAEQIGGQIFIDAWGLAQPGDPEAAAELARRAASVSHDGEAIHAARVVAAMIAAAFVESDVDALIDAGLARIPRDCVIRRMIDDVRQWHADAPQDWRRALRRIHENYPYERFGGICPVVPNHALIHLALLFSGGDFGVAMKIVNTAGWDTDCNAGNVGCLLGVRNGLAALSAGPDWRRPVADRLLLPSAEGGAAVTDAVRETYFIVNSARALRGLPPVTPKNGARFHFSLPGSVQGFREDNSPECRGVVEVGNSAVPGDERGLDVAFSSMAPGRPARILTPTFTPPEPVDIGWYPMVASPTLYGGQTLRARLTPVDVDCADDVSVGFAVRVYDAGGKTRLVTGPKLPLRRPGPLELEWNVPVLDGYPIAAVGLELTSLAPARGRVVVDWIDWTGAPRDLSLMPPPAGDIWITQWTTNLDRLVRASNHAGFTVQSDQGPALAIQGTRDWRDYSVQGRFHVALAQAFGVAARVQGLRRYYALQLFPEGVAKVVKRVGRTETVLAELPGPPLLDRTVSLRLEVCGTTLTAEVDGVRATVSDTAPGTLAGGACALLLDRGTAHVRDLGVRALGA